MVSSNATEPTVNFFLETLRKRNPDVIPSVFMSDFDKTQIKVIPRWYPEALLLLCWWHVLHAWQQHITTSHYPELWALLKGWIRITNKSQFDECWEKIQVLAPASFISYIMEYWLPVRELWSAQERTERNIFELGDTNMLVEAYVFVLNCYLVCHS